MLTMTDLALSWQTRPALRPREPAAPGRKCTV